MALALIVKAKAGTWANFAAQWHAQGADATLGGIMMTEEDRALMSRHSWVVSRCSLTPKSVPLACATCGRVAMSVTASKDKCFLTDGCAGQLVPTVKASLVAPGDPALPDTGATDASIDM